MSGFCCDVGLDETLYHVRDFCILRLVANVPAQSLLKSSCENITLSMLTAYSRILTSFQTGEKKDFDNMFDSNLMDWMKSLIDCTSSYHMQQVNLISPPLNQPGPHTVLYLYVAQSKRRKGDLGANFIRLRNFQIDIFTRILEIWTTFPTSLVTSARAKRHRSVEAHLIK
ncbi:hypothetical protein Btru_041499 [Bulinus truncatus]|nr:hypothetical protein Btru_041499 [Bulinus truncatus]